VADSYSFLILIPWTRELAGVPAIAHGHHEKLDGSGYPMGLRGGQISLQTRILTISDIYDALTACDRPYKQAVPAERALDLIAEECRAGHLDGPVQGLRRIQGMGFARACMTAQLAQEIAMSLQMSLRRRDRRQLLLAGAVLATAVRLRRRQHEALPASRHAGQGGMVEPEGLAAGAGRHDRADWWKQFRDPYLDGLVNRRRGRQLRPEDPGRAHPRGRQRNRRGARRRLPTLDAGAGASFEKSTGQPFSKQFNLGTQVNWDIDVWGKVAKGVEAQTAEFKATEADWRAGYLTLVSDVSTTYFQILQFDEQIAQQKKTLEKNEQILATYEAMQQEGLVPQTRVLQQRAEINKLSNDLIELGRLRKLAGNALATLLGVPAGDFTRCPPAPCRQRVQLPTVPEGLPSQLLKRRPDVVAAEYRVLVAYDLVGQAKLAQLPSISLTGRGGTSSLALGTC
jgi:outer membrane protein TolC